ncbi:MAG: TetR/AcrR family transcriptional regulator [Mariprofundaceae bacterium]
MQLSKTKKKILETSLELFNNSGTKAVSTNHIAKACSISPGNLYYHYKNKEHIILALLEKMIDEWDEKSASQESLTLVEQSERTFSCVWKYRFLHRELVSLFHAEKAFASLCSSTLQRRLKEVLVVLNDMEKQGFFKPLDATSKDFLSHTLLFMALFWMPYLEVTGQVDSEENIKHGSHMMMQLMLPYIKGENHA